MYEFYCVGTIGEHRHWRERHKPNKDNWIEGGEKGMRFTRI